MLAAPRKRGRPFLASPCPLQTERVKGMSFGLTPYPLSGGEGNRNRALLDYWWFIHWSLLAFNKLKIKSHIRTIKKFSLENPGIIIHPEV
jgi:hypothetical protein